MKEKLIVLRVTFELMNVWSSEVFEEKGYQAVQSGDCALP